MCDVTIMCHQCHANILPSTGQENTAQPKTDLWFGFSSHFSHNIHYITPIMSCQHSSLYWEFCLPPPPPPPIKPLIKIKIIGFPLHITNRFFPWVLPFIPRDVCNPPPPPLSNSPWIFIPKLSIFVLFMPTLFQALNRKTPQLNRKQVSDLTLHLTFPCLTVIL